MFNICNEPDIMECSDERCWLTEGCRYLDKCMHKLVNSIYDGFTCECAYIDNGFQVFQLPDCIIYTNSPTLKPTDFPSISPPSIQINDSMLENDLQESSQDHFDENLLYYILGPCIAVLILCIYFHRRIYRCIKIDCLGGEEENDDDENDDGDV